MITRKFNSPNAATKIFIINFGNHQNKLKNQYDFSFFGKFLGKNLFNNSNFRARRDDKSIDP